MRALVVRTFGSVSTGDGASELDSKTALQELLQAAGRPLPRYEPVSQRGPDHASEWEVQVSVEEKVLGSGVGRSKRDAEQAAAKVALEHLRR